MDRYALIGFPLGHSLSPQIHSRLFSLTGTAAEYEKKEISPENLPNEYDWLTSLRGFNITIPHKVAIIDYCDRLDDGAEQVEMSVGIVYRAACYFDVCVGLQRCDLALYFFRLIAVGIQNGYGKFAARKRRFYRHHSAYAAAADKQYL